ncbi:PorT family protein [Hymenobacter arizonensis]|nr:PorT family protein [Hymenobacter arizonensis]
MRFALLLLTFALLSVTAASAQTTYRLGLRGGGNRATTTLDAASSGASGPFSYSTEKSSILAWQAGAVLEIAFRNFSLQSAMLFSQKGESLNTSSNVEYTNATFGIINSGNNTRSSNRYNWLELPVNVVYQVSNFQLFGGPYAALGVGGQRRGTTLSYHPAIKYAPYHFNDKIRYGSDTYNSRLDAGLNLGIGYRRGPMQVQVAYQLGLVNLHPSEPYLLYDYGHDFARDAAHNRVVQLTGTYFFDL